MVSDEILARLQDLVERELAEHWGLTAHPSYRWDLFRLFREAYDQRGGTPLLIDSMKDRLVQRLKDFPGGENKDELVDEVIWMWREWEYALDQYDRNPELG